MAKVTFTMDSPTEKKHSVQFSFEALEEATGIDQLIAKNELRRASFYIPKPIAERAKRIRVTIEEL